jgi:predicted RNase H-like HicB family nuclease
MCSTFGTTLAEELAEVEMAKMAWVEAAKAKGCIIPEPRYKPGIY